MKTFKALASLCITGALQLAAHSAFAQDMMIISVFDGPLTGGTPKGVQLKVLSDIADLSEYSVNAFSNGNPDNTSVYQFPAEAASAGSYLYLTTDNAQFQTFFGLPAQYVTGEVGINGDDPVGLLQNGVLVDTFAPPNVRGTNQPWNYADGWAARKASVIAPNATFDISEWDFGGPDSLEGGGTNATAATPLPTIPPAQVGPTPKANGESCANALECNSGNCIEGVCCDTACGEGDTLDCLSCLGINTGGADGSCAPIGSGTSCGPTPVGECADAGQCNDAGECVGLFKGSDQECGSPASQCKEADHCDGQGACVAGSPINAGGSCGNAGTECMEGDVCNDAGQCVAGSPKSSTTVCGSDVPDCMEADHCDGAGACVAGNPKPANTACGDTSDAGCNAPDVCDGSGACVNKVKPAGTDCGNEETECMEGDSCDGAGACVAGNPKSSTTACGNEGTECMEGDKCDGAGACAAGSPKPSTTSCGDSSDAGCNAPDHCDGSGVCINKLDPAGTACGNAESECLLGDSCNDAGVCVPGEAKPDLTPCGDPTVDECNLADSCEAGVCIDRVAEAGTACGSEDDSACDRSDTCDGAGSCSENVLTADDDCDDQVACTVGLCDESQECSVDDSGCAVICKDADYWANRPSVSTELVEQLELIEVCGSRINNVDCALEGLCVADEAAPETLLRRQLLVTAMNCKAFNGQGSCSRSEVQELFEACNQICTGSDEAAMTACIAQLECHNAGGSWFQPTGFDGECDLPVEGQGCGATPVEANGMLAAAGAPDASLCTSAQGTPEGLIDACEALADQSPNNDGDLDGINDAQDTCPGTPLGTLVDNAGCDVLNYCECDRAWERGEFMVCVRDLLGGWERSGFISRNERRSETQKMSASECGLRRREERNPFRDRLRNLDALPDWLIELIQG